MAITVTQQKTIIELYSAYFNRAADADGVTFWENSFEIYFTHAPESFTEEIKEQFALIKVSEDISTATEYTTLYPSTLANFDFITQVYTTLLKREPDSEGRDFWVGHLDNGTMSEDEAIIRMIEGAKSNLTEQGIKDAALIANKTEVASYFVDPLQSNDLELAKTVFANITSSTTTVTAAKAALDLALGVIHISADNAFSQQGTDGVADFFIYQIDSSRFIFESKENADISLQAFTVGEDKLVFDDVKNKTTTTTAFIEQAAINTQANTQIIFEKVIIDNDNALIAEAGVSLTLQGVTDFTAVDFAVV